MSLTANYDYCAEFTIAVIRSIFHEAFRDETVGGEPAFPHDFGPLERNFSGRAATVRVRVYDDMDRPADLEFQDTKHIRFTFPIDISVILHDSPDPTLSEMVLAAIVKVPAALATWEEVAGSDEWFLGLDFAGVTPADVQIVSLTGVPVLDDTRLANAVHKRYTTIPHVYNQSGARLVLYDGGSDPLLTPPNMATPSAIQAVLETHSGKRYAKITAPFHLSVPIPPPGAGTFQTYGRILFWREIVTSADETHITVNMAAEPASASLKTDIQFDTAPTTGDTLVQIRTYIHDRYLLIPHEYSVTVPVTGTLTLYDDNADPSLDPSLPVTAVPYQIDAVLESHSGLDYVKVTIPIHVDLSNVPIIGVYASFGRIRFWRQLVPDPVSGGFTVNMAVEPAPVMLKTVVEFDSGLQIVKDQVSAAITPLVVTALGGFGTMNAPGLGTLEAQMLPFVLSSLANFGTIVEPLFSQQAAETLLKAEISNYMKTRKFPVYTPRSPDPEEFPVGKPVGWLLVADQVLAVLFNQRSGAPDDVAPPPENFLNGGQFALAVGRARLDELIAKAIKDEFKNLDTEDGEHIVTAEGDAHLKRLNVTPSDPGEHGESEGHLWVSGMAEVHIDCWPDPDVDFDGPVFVDANTDVDADGRCTLELKGRAGEFDFDQSCCDILLDIFIPILGWIVYFIVESTVESVGGAMAGQIAAGQGELIDAIPRTVIGVASVEACVFDFMIFSRGVVLPGTVSVRRDTRSYQDVKDGGGLPRPDNP
jgi:hypothetical protein